MPRYAVRRRIAGRTTVEDNAGVDVGVVPDDASGPHVAIGSRLADVREGVVLNVEVALAGRISAPNVGPATSRRDVIEHVGIGPIARRDLVVVQQTTVRGQLHRLP